MGTEIIIDGSGFRRGAEKMIRRAANAVAVVQKEQVAAAFANNGQPGSKWPGLWANNFVGKASAASVQQHNRALLRLRLRESKLEMVKGTTHVARAKRNWNKKKIREALRAVKNAEKKIINATSYRKGGNPLQDNGHLKASFFRKHVLVFGTDAIIALASSSPYAPYHQAGFTTKGPNFIPLTLKARRMHQLGMNPLLEDLEEGVDYIMAWHGVTVPARPMIDYSDPVNKTQIQETILDAMRG